jgi:hypothetical protein
MQHQFNLNIVKKWIKYESGVMIWYLKSPVPPQTESRRSGAGCNTPQDTT